MVVSGLLAGCHAAQTQTSYYRELLAPLYSQPGPIFVAACSSQWRWKIKLSFFKITEPPDKMTGFVVRATPLFCSSENSRGVGLYLSCNLLFFVAAFVSVVCAHMCLWGEPYLCSDAATSEDAFASYHQTSFSSLPCCVSFHWGRQLIISMLPMFIC